MRPIAPKKWRKDHIHRKDKPLTEQVKGIKRATSTVRVRVEHVFNAQTNDIGGTLVRSSSLVRAKASLKIKNLAYIICEALFNCAASTRVRREYRAPQRAAHASWHDKQNLKTTTLRLRDPANFRTAATLLFQAARATTHVQEFFRIEVSLKVLKRPQPNVGGCNDCMPRRIGIGLKTYHLSYSFLEAGPASCVFCTQK